MRYAALPVRVVLVAALAGCAGAVVQPGARAVLNPSGAVRSPGAMQPDRGPSWMAPLPDRCGYDEVLPPCGLLYVTNYVDDDVLVFQRDKLVGTLTGFAGPDGLCTDFSGNVWITNNQGASIVEYAHGGTQVIKTLGDPGEYPVGCSVDPINRVLAVTNIFTTGSGPGSVAIYHKDTGKPLLITDPEIYYIFYCAFDAAGNLYIDGLDTQSNVHFAWLPRNKFHFREISLGTTIYWPGNVQWDGRHVDVGDQRYQNSDQSAVYVTNGAGGKIRGTAVFSGAQDVAGYWVHTNSLIAPDVKLNEVGLYHYPQGGKATILLRHFDQPLGTTVSIVHHGNQMPDALPAPHASPAVPARPGPKPRGWIARNIPQRVVYVADNNEVIVFPEHAHNGPPVGEITDGVTSAYGLWVDQNGYLYVANQYGNNVAVYPPNSTKPSQYYSQSLSRPLYPVVDRDGDLWVGNAHNGTVVEYKHGHTNAHEILQTPGVEADGMDFDQQGNLYVAYRTSSKGYGSIEEFAPGSTKGTVLGMSLNQPQSVVVVPNGTILAVETGGTNRVDVFPPGYKTPTLEVGVSKTPTQLAITQKYHSLFVSSLTEGEIWVTPYPLLNPKGSHNQLHEKINVNGYGVVQGIALSNGQIF